MIGVDWGTTSFRAFRINPDGTFRDRRVAQRGIQNVKDGRFADTLREEIGPWLAGGEQHVLLCGMVGSRQGWKEAPYIPCPAGAQEIAASLVNVEFDWARVKVVPGVITTDANGVTEVMRGEETQIIGVLSAFAGGGIACLPGTHSKWARVEGGRITGFETYMTGETYAALRGHTILSRMMRDGATDIAAFDDGVRRSGNSGGLLHHVFGVRALALSGRLSDASTSSYLSGILIGHEVRAAMQYGQTSVVHVIGAPELTTLYARAISACDGFPERHDGEASARGLALIGKNAQWN